jgi:hypothetical protein
MIVCDNWVSRIIEKGEDHVGLGQWSYVTLQGKGSTKVTVITAYNSFYNMGDTTNYRQQQHTLSTLHSQHNQRVNAQPRRQFILDLQGWISHLISLDHEIILSMDANMSYNPDVTVPHTLKESQL